MARSRNSRSKQSSRPGGGAGSVRLIGGQWRGRRLPVADAPGLRPTGDRARETLFNWLQARIAGARCADLFAGTGALGFEAASRGAAGVVLVERSAPVADMLRQSAEVLGADQVTVAQADAFEWLESCAPSSLDIVFVDPPFDGDLAGRALARLGSGHCLAPGGLVYLESPHRPTPAPPAGFVPLRDKVMGEVRLELLEWRPGD